ncbi:TrkH family potassium uptake protein [Streptomyces sp. OfavH-34-F]|uniref:TrkH family potassium uptake protein n=1 Tax=Streptomyces sp. OfavH-34-F TaxID=2917760 RepID=UPI001EF2DA80|nr:potassium transporter TrkG [Streptomyces sp. OfavH-34-F]MCG7523278.1 TrkH family potassium uptake protein [Streptomyces sp. OfavH-34-F]
MSRRWPRLRHPAQVVVAGFATAIAVGTGLLMLPAAKAGPGGAGVLEALFTSTSSVCVTGLIVVDTPGYWTGFGQAVILALIQVGGFGIMTFASLLVLLVSHRMGLKARMTAAAETKALGLGDVRVVVVGVVKVSLVLEAVTALALALRFATGYDEPWPRALWLGVFHAISAFNNAGFALYSDSLMGFATDPYICLPIAMAVIAGGLGFPVLFELRRRIRTPRGWSLHTKIVLCTSAVFLVGGSVFVTALEWSNAATLGPLDVPGKLLAGFFQGVMPRTAGFNSIDTSQMTPASWLGTDVLMFIGGASAGTAGGIKVTTFAVLFFVIYAEIRGEGAVNIFNRRLHGDLQRQALTVVLLSVGAVAITTVTFMVFSDHSLDRSLFEVVSAFATVGLSTGITADLPSGLQLLLIALMFLGRLGPITVASALALRSRVRLYDLPEERPVIG